MINQLLNNYLEHGNYCIPTADITNIQQFRAEHTALKEHFKSLDLTVSADMAKYLSGFMETYHYFVFRVDGSSDVAFYFTNSEYGIRKSYDNGRSLKDIYE